MGEMGEMGDMGETGAKVQVQIAIHAACFIFASECAPPFLPLLQFAVFGTVATDRPQTPSLLRCSKRHCLFKHQEVQKLCTHKHTETHRDTQRHDLLHRAREERGQAADSPTRSGRRVNHKARYCAVETRCHVPYGLGAWRGLRGLSEL